MIHVVPASFRSLRLLSGLSLLLILTACSASQNQGGFTPPPTPVEVADVTQGTVADRFSTVGSIAAGDAIAVTAEIDGVLVALPFAEGRPVAAGDLIARLDDVQLRAEAQRAAAVRDQRQASYRRIRSVVENGAGAPQDLDDATAALKVAEAEVDLAQARLAKTRVTAPFAGVAGARRVSRGAFLRAGTAITDLARIDRLRLLFSVPERLLSRLELGAEVRVETTAYPGESVTGTVDVIEPQLDPGTRSASVVAHVANRDSRLRPGMSATITIVLGRRSQALTVPSDAVFVSGGQAFVFVVKADSTVTRAAVELGSRQYERVEVLTGLTAAQQVVSAGHQKLYEGARVMPVTGDDAAVGAETEAADANGAG